MGITNFKKTLLFFLISLILSFNCIIVNAENSFEKISNETTLSEENTVSYTVSYGKGIYISYGGNEPNDFIKGEPPVSQKVCENGTVVVAQNTFTFRDYSFAGWKYTYKNDKGEKKNKYFSPNEEITNITCNMKLEATWTKKQTDLKITAYTTYADTNLKSENFLGEIISLKQAPPPPADNYEFCGWTDNEENILYSQGDSYEIKNINTVIKPVWSINGEKLNYKKISVNVSKGGHSSITHIFILPGTAYEISFKADEGYFLEDVTIDGKSEGASEKITVTVGENDIYINGTFSEIPAPPENSSEEESSAEQEKFTVTIITEGEGKVSPSKNITVNKGEKITFLFTPGENHRLPLQFTHNGVTQFCDYTWDGVYTIENISENHEIEFSFIPERNIESPNISTTSKPDPNTPKNTSSFTKGTMVVILIFAAGFGAAAIAFTRHSNTKQNKKRK